MPRNPCGARRHRGVRPLEEGLQGPRRGFEQGFALRGAEGDAHDALTVAAGRPDSDVSGAGGPVQALGEQIAGEHPFDRLFGSGVEGGVHGIRIGRVVPQARGYRQ